MHYFDHNATTPIAEEVFEAMEPFLRDRWGNPSSIYDFGRRERKAIDRARHSVAGLLNAAPKEIVFTGGGTESSNTAFNCALNVGDRRPHLILTSVEHSCGLRAAEYYERRGHRVSQLSVGSDGSLDLDELESLLAEDTGLVSVMWANNETGILFPVEPIARSCRQRGIPCHSDAVQAAGKIPIDVRSAGLDYLSLSGHKLYAPKGVGALYVRTGAPWQSFILGGTQENGRRGGTCNVASIVALGAAADLAQKRMVESEAKDRRLRDRLEEGLLSLPSVYRNGMADNRLFNTAYLAFEGVESEALVLLLEKEGICVSSGSACMAGSTEPSHVLTAMNVPRSRALGSVRFSLGRTSTDRDVARVLEVLPQQLERLRNSVASRNPR